MSHTSSDSYCNHNSNPNVPGSCVYVCLSQKTIANCSLGIHAIRMNDAMYMSVDHLYSQWDGKITRLISFQANC